MTKTMQKLALSAPGIFAASLLGAGPALAHHSAATFDTSTVLKITGVITQFRWSNPHASIKIKGKADGGRFGLWTIGMSTPNQLVDDGWSRFTVKPGDKVTLYVNPRKIQTVGKDGSYEALYVGVTLPNGKTLGRVDGKPRQGTAHRRH